MMMTSDETYAIRDAAVATMRDTCQIGTRSTPTGNDPGDVTYTYGAAIRCGYHPQTTSEVLDNGSQATITSANIRLPWGTLIDTEARIKIVTQAGDMLTPAPVYAVVGAHFGALCNYVVTAKRITGGSTL